MRKWSKMTYSQRTASEIDFFDLVNLRFGLVFLFLKGLGVEGLGLKVEVKNRS